MLLKGGVASANSKLPAPIRQPFPALQPKNQSTQFLAGCGFCSPEAGLTSENCRSTLEALRSNAGREATSFDIRSLSVGSGGLRIRRAQSGRARYYF